MDVLYPFWKGGEQRFLGNLYDNEGRSRSINITNRPKISSKFTDETFQERMANEFETNDITFCAYSKDTKQVQLTLAEWQQFWALHSIHADSDAQVMDGLSAAYLPETQSVRLTIQGEVTKRNNARWNMNYKRIYNLTENEAYPGPFTDLKTGTGEYALYKGLPPLETGQLPDPAILNE